MGQKDLPEWLRVVATGRKIRRAEWKDAKGPNGEERDVHIGLLDGKLVIKAVEDGIYHPWTISIDDIYAEDWEIV